MACYFKWRAVVGGESRLLSCGQCIGCRLEYSRQWAVRCMHEAKCHLENCYITLTYADAPFSLEHRDFQLFMKKLRKALAPQTVRFYMSGEYGEENGRPHFHACLFGVNFADRKYYRMSPAGFKLFTSEMLSDIWGHGFVTVGDVSFESAAYVARYVTKKVTGAGADAFYQYVVPDTGEIVQRVPEYSRMSLRPGIGHAWLSRFRSDVYPEGMVLVNGVEARPPRYYDEIFRRSDAGGYMRLCAARRAFADKLESATDGNGRIESKEVVARARLSLSKRTL